MKTIVVPTDYSDTALKALHLAIDIAKKSNARLVVFNAYDLPYSQNVMTTSLLEVMRENSELGLKDIDELLKVTGLNYQVRSILGNPIRTVKDLVKKENADMVILGTKGASGIEEVLIGSNAAAILHAVDCPVLAVPSEGDSGEIKDIVYACDNRYEGEGNAMEQLRAFAQLTGAKVSIVHVQSPDDNELHVINKLYYQRHLDGIELSFDVIAENGSIDQSLLRFAEERNADVMALLARKYGFLQGLFHKSMTSQVAYHSRLPFLTLHEG